MKNNMIEETVKSSNKQEWENIPFSTTTGLLIPQTVAVIKKRTDAMHVVKKKALSSNYFEPCCCDQILNEDVIFKTILISMGFNIWHAVSHFK